MTAVSFMDWPDKQNPGRPLFYVSSGWHLLVRKSDGIETPELMRWEASSSMWESPIGQKDTPAAVASIYSYYAICLQISDLDMCDRIRDDFVASGNEALDKNIDVAGAKFWCSLAKVAVGLKRAILSEKEDVRFLRSAETINERMVELSAMAICESRLGARSDFALSDWKKTPEWSIYLQIARTALSAAYL